MNSRSKRYTHEEKSEAVRRYIEMRKRGITRTEAVKELGVSDPTIGKWVRNYGGKTEEPAREVVKESNGFSDQLKQLRIENNRLRMIVSDLMLDRQQLLEYAGRK